MTDDGMEEIVEEFLAECGDILNATDEILVRAETDGLTENDIGALFRGIHTIKGTAAFLDFGVMSSVAHDAEHLLSRVRDKAVEMTRQRTDLLLEASDALRSMLAEIEATGREGERDYTDLAGRLAEAAIYREESHEPEASEATEQPLLEETENETQDKKPEVSQDVPEAGSEEPRRERKTESEQATIRVDTGVLDRLIDLVGELVLARNQLVASGSDLGAAGQRLNHVVTELQEGIMRTRMQPVATLLAKAPRIARDAANQLEKRVRVIVDAGDTELDRGVLEAVRDPLTHLLRNAVDHGIERPSERQAAGKHPEGNIDIRAWHESGHVVVEVRDDGRGIDPERVKNKALERGLVDQKKASSMGINEIHQLLLMPGFSTAEQVTAVSGRGVGMDVVKSNIEKIGGTIEVESEMQRGTAWRLRIPLTLAILPALIVKVGEYRIAIPSSSLREALRIDASQIETIGEREILRLRGAVLPLVRLMDALGVKRGNEKTETRVIVVSGGQGRVGLMVDEIGDPAEIVVKPLGSLLAGVSSISGAAVMGDGRVAYILDITHVTDDTPERKTDNSERGEDLSEGANAEVIVGHIGGVRTAFDMGGVERLERFAREDFERSGSRTLVQYRGGLLEVRGETESGYVVVCRGRDGAAYGVAVDDIEDVSEIQTADEKSYVIGGSVALRFETTGEHR